MRVLSFSSPLGAMLVSAAYAKISVASDGDPSNHNESLFKLKAAHIPPESNGQGASDPTNTNACIIQVGTIASAFATPFSDETTPTDICEDFGADLVEAFTMGCFCNPTMVVLTGEVIVGRMLVALPVCREIIAAEDMHMHQETKSKKHKAKGKTQKAKGKKQTSRSYCKKFENRDYGCKVENMALDAARLDSIQRFGSVFDGAGTDQCFDFESLTYQFSQVFDNDPSISVPYGIGLYEGIEKMIEYLGIYFASLNRNFWNPGPGIPFGGQFSSDGTSFTSKSGVPGAFALGQILFGDPAEGQLPPWTSYQKFNFKDCTDKISSVEVLPNSGVAWVTSNFRYIAENFDLWGVDSICECDDQICRTANHSAYANKAECLSVIGNLPPYSEKCGPNRPLAGNSLGCKFKHHFMAALVPETHCKHLGPEGTLDSEGVLKCVDEVECEDSPEAYQAFLDATALALGEEVGSNYVMEIIDDNLYTNAIASTNQVYEQDGWQPPVLTCPAIDGIWRGYAPETFPETDPPFPNQFSTPNGGGDSLPIALEDAQVDGWVQDGENGPYTKSGSAFGLYFDDEGLKGFKVTGPAITLPSDPFNPIAIPGTTINEFQMSYDFRFGEDSWVLGDEIEIPLRSEVADEDGWLQGSCLESMGGTHYFKQELSLPGITLLYNKYGDGRLTAVIPIFGVAYDPTDPISSLPFGNEFDISGSLSPLSATCSNVYCGDTVCTENFCSGDGEAGCNETDLFPFVTKVHVYFKDPAFVQTKSSAGFPIAKCSSLASPCWLRQTAFDLGQEFIASGFNCDCSGDTKGSGYY